MVLFSNLKGCGISKGTVVHKCLCPVNLFNAISTSLKSQIACKRCKYRACPRGIGISSSAGARKFMTIEFGAELRIPFTGNSKVHVERFSWISWFEAISSTSRFPAQVLFSLSSQWCDCVWNCLPNNTTGWNQNSHCIFKNEKRLVCSLTIHYIFDIELHQRKLNRKRL